MPRCVFIYRYILNEFCSRFDLPPSYINILKPSMRSLEHAPAAEKFKKKVKAKRKRKEAKRKPKKDDE